MDGDDAFRDHRARRFDLLHGHAIAPVGRRVGLAGGFGGGWIAQAQYKKQRCQQTPGMGNEGAISHEWEFVQNRFPCKSTFIIVIAAADL